MSVRKGSGTNAEDRFFAGLGRLLTFSGWGNKRSFEGREWDLYLDFPNRNDCLGQLEPYRVRSVERIPVVASGQMTAEQVVEGMRTLGTKTSAAFRGRAGSLECDDSPLGTVILFRKPVLWGLGGRATGLLKDRSGRLYIINP